MSRASLSNLSFASGDTFPTSRCYRVEMNRKAVYFIAVWLMCTSALFADQARSWSVLPVPIMFYGPSTGIAGGVMGIVDFGQNRIQAGGLYTQKRQSLAFAEGRFFFRGGDLLLVNQLAFSYFPRVFYGIGPQADMKEQYTPRDAHIESFLGIQVAENLYVGPSYRLLCSDIVKTEEGGLLEYGQVGGSDGTIISGGGARLIWDRRDHELFPRRGTYLTWKPACFAPNWGAGRTLPCSSSMRAATCPCLSDRCWPSSTC